ncbi:MAG: hypothetical protein JXB04_04235, partial [Kiritimatiellae bacterium]|nr:hypothetical protein [Kiritimatiellia bacterium]
VWDRYVDTCTLGEYGGYECIMTGQLFCRQVPHAFIPFSRLRDRKVDWFLDTVNALLADRVFNMRVNQYPPQLWGLTDVFGKDSYSHGAPPGPIMNDGTIGTTAFAGALPHVPELSLEAMKYVREKFGDRVYGRYGFTSSVNEQNDFVSPLYVGIELGPMIQLIENARSGLIWNLFRRSPVMRNFVERAGMSGVVDDFELPPEAPAYAAWSVQGGRAKTGDDAPHHGKRCLEIRADGEGLLIEARLPANQLLAYGFSRYLSLWARDLDPAMCCVTVDGRTTALALAGSVPGQGWTQYYYELPPHMVTSAFCALTLEARAAGARPALDNITLQAVADLAAPDPVRDLTAQPGRGGGVVDLTWTAPRDAGTDHVARYLVTALAAGPTAAGHQIDLETVAGPAEREQRSLLLNPGATYRVTVTPVDTHGHAGPPSDPVQVVAATGHIQRTAYDFEGLSLQGVENPQPNWKVEIVEQDGGQALRVAFDKSHGWNHIFLQLDPEMVALHRYITMKVKGKVELLGKLWCAQELQHDVEALRSESEERWTEFRFDTRKATVINPARDPVRKLILFPEPGRWSGGGWFMIDDVTYEN